jgi:hypothetical protein
VILVGERGLDQSAEECGDAEAVIEIDVVVKVVVGTVGK